MSRARSRVLVTAFLLIAMLPGPTLAAAPQSAAERLAAAVNPDLEHGQLERRGGAAPTKDETTRPNRVLARVEGAARTAIPAPLQASDTAQIEIAPDPTGDLTSPESATAATDTPAPAALGSPTSNIVLGYQETGEQIATATGTYTGTYTPMSSGVRDRVVIEASGTTVPGKVTIAAPLGQTLSVGTFQATRFSSDLLYAFRVEMSPATCASTGTAEITIHELVTNGSNVTLFSASMAFTCGSDPTMWAEVRFNSTLEWAVASPSPAPPFELTEVGGTSPVVFSGVHNFGNLAVTLGPAVVTGDPDIDITVDSCSNTVISPGGFCSVQATFSPTAPKAAEASISFTATTTAGQARIDFSGVTKATVTIASAGSATGSVQVGFGGQCSNCSFPSWYGAELTFVAQPGDNALFGSWGGDCAFAGTSPTCTVTITSATLSVVANWLLAYQVHVQDQIFSGSVTSSPAGIDCPGTCWAKFAAGTQVTLTYNAPSGYDLLGWTGSCAGVGPCTLTMNGNKTVGVNYGTKWARAAKFIGTTPNLRVSGGFEGDGDDDFRCADRPCYEPPNTSLAVGPSHLMQATADGIRISDRSGTVLADYFLWDFFFEDLDETASWDARVTYDPSSERWMATQVSTDCTNGSIYVAVSMTSNPLGSWSVYIDELANLFPDSPALGRSSDKVAIGYNLLGQSPCYNAYPQRVGAELLIVDRASLVAGPASLPTGTIAFDDSTMHIMPAVAASIGNDLWVVAGGGAGPVPVSLLAGRIVGTVGGGSAKLVHPGALTAGFENLSASQNATGFQENSLAFTLDGRPTSAISFGNSMWFAATNPCRPTSNTEQLCVRVTKIGPSGVVDEFAFGTPLGPTLGGGIAVNGVGTVFFTFTQTTTSSPFRMAPFAAYKLASDPVGMVHPPARLATASTTYAGSYWAEQVGIARDHNDSGGVWFSSPYVDGGGWSTRVGRLGVNTGAPSGTVQVNGGTASTTSPMVSVKVAASATGGATEALISNSPTMNGVILAKSLRIPLGTVPNWSLTNTTYGGSNATGVRTVYVQFGRGNGTWSTPVAATITFQSVKVSRLAGPDRYATAAAVSAATYTPGVEVAYVSTGTAFAEPLAAAPLAGWLRGPLLLTAPTVLPAATATELQRLKPRYIVVVGGTGIVSEAVRSSMAKYTTSGYVFRDAGADRFETAAIAAVNTFEPGVPVAYVAYGGNFPDALAAAAAGGYLGGPVLLTNTGSVPPYTQAALDLLDPKKIVVVGSTAVVNSAAFSVINAYGPTVRVAGADRFATAVAISKSTFLAGVPVVYIAYAFNFPDALSGAAAAGFRGGPVLLTGTTTLHPATAAELARLKPKRIVVLGSTGVISTTVFNQLAPYATGP